MTARPREVAGRDQRRAGVVTAPSAFVEHRTRAPKGCLTKYRSQRFGARVPSLVAPTDSHSGEPAGIHAQVHAKHGSAMTLRHGAYAL